MKFGIGPHPHSTFFALTPPQPHPPFSHPISLFLHSHSQPSFHTTRPNAGYVAVAMPALQGQASCYRLACANLSWMWDLLQRPHRWRQTRCPYSANAIFQKRGVVNRDSRWVEFLLEEVSRYQNGLLSLHIHVRGL